MTRWDLTEVQAEAILNMRLRALRRLEEIAIRKELDTLSAEEASSTRTAGEREKTMARDRQRGSRNRRRIRRRHSAGPPPHRDRRRPGTDRDPGRGTGRARAGDGAVLGQGLDPRRQGAQRLGRRSEIQGGRRGALCDRCRDHRPPDRLRHERPLLHDRRRSAAGRPRPRRAIAADDRSAERARHRRDVALPARHGAAGGGERRAWLCRRRRRGGGPDPSRQASTDPGRGRGRAGLRAGRGATLSPLSATTARCWSSSSTTSR